MMTDIHNKAARAALIDRYLAGETSLAEERMLQHYFAQHEADADERAIAALVAATPLAGIPEEALLSDAGEREFDELVARQAARRRLRPRPYFYFAFAAAAVALLLILMPFPRRNDQQQLTTIDILGSLEMLSAMGASDFQAMTAEPQGQHVMITVTCNDGTELHFRLTKDFKNNSTELISMND